MILFGLHYFITMKHEKDRKMRKLKLLQVKLLSMMMVMGLLLGLAQTSSAQATATLSGIQAQIDDNYVADKQDLLETEIQEVRNDSQMGEEEKIVRVKLLSRVSEYVGHGMLIENTWDIAYSALRETVQSTYPNIPLKDYVTEYKNQF